MADAARQVSHEEDQRSAWKFLLNLRGMDPLPQVKLTFTDGTVKEGLLAGCSSHVLGPGNLVFIKLVELEDRSHIADFESDPNCHGFEFSIVSKVEANS